MKKVLLVNEGNSGNLGDQLINYSLQRILSDSLTNQYKVHWHSYSFVDNENNTTTEIDERKFTKIDKIKSKIGQTFLYKSIARRKWLEHNKNKIKKLMSSDYDILLIGGGQLLNSSWLYPYLFTKWIKLFKGKKIATIAIGIGKGLNIFDKQIVNKALSECQAITVRDLYSKKIVEEKFNQKCKLIPDPVLLISNFIKTEKNSNYAIILPASFENVYLRYNTKLDEAEYLDVWVKKIEDYLKYHAKIIVSITDIIQDVKVFNQLKTMYSTHHNVEFILPNNAIHLVELIGSSELVYSARMHALIIGLSYNINCEVMEISPKLKDFKKQYIENHNFKIEDTKVEVMSKLEQILVEL